MATPVRALIDETRIAARVRELGAEITADYAGIDELVMICALKGSFVFAADLARAIDRPLCIEFVGLRSYGDARESSGVVEITLDLARPIEGKHVLVAEDIVDTGLTLQSLLENLRTRRPASVHVATLLRKRGRGRVENPLRYVGFDIDDVFVVGYGLDFAQRHRNLPYVGVLESDG